eukprot:TRINITY_DN4141_c0_g1_i1.p1 TRINITY_DN4141_c0_g1~~TRINITY_DN4141_c0_g1_i1.p1  ORF type:complete len:222 (-),score=56.34 TRINITY_DN4141_c0_g1_i1:585-1250(-)
MSDVEKFNEDIEELNKGLDRLDEHLKLIYKFKNLDELSDQISISDYAKLNTSLAYALNSLYYVYMKANAIPFEDHKINSEIRIKNYFQRVQKALSIEKPRENDNPVSINKDALRRIIQNQVSMTETNVGVAVGEKGGMEEEKTQSNKASTSVEKESKQKTNNKKTAMEIEDPNKDLDALDKELENYDMSDKKKPGKKLHKGSLLPSGAHLTWKNQLDKILK